MPHIRAIILIAALAAAAPCCAFADAARNLTQTNRAALTAKADELQRSELMRVTRGRLKASPVIFPFHTIYQAVLQQNDLLIRNQAESFAGSLARLEKTFDSYRPELGTQAGRDAQDYFRRELVRLYDLSGPLAGSKSLMDVWLAVQTSVYGMEALPSRAALALNAVRWLSKKQPGGKPPGDITPLLDPIIREWNPASDIFQTDVSLRALSADYSKLFLRAAESKDISSSERPAQ